MKKLRTTLVTLAAGTLVLTGCGAGSAGSAEDRPDPKAELTTALTTLSERGSSSVTASVEGDVETLRTLVNDGSSSDWSTQDVETLLGSSFTATGSEGDDAASSSDDSASFAIVVGGADAVEMRYLEDTVYLQADLEALEEQFPEISEDLGQIRTDVGASPELSSLVPLLEGDWVSLDVAEGSQARSLYDQYSSAGAAQAAPAPSPAQAQEALRSIVEGSAVTRDEDDADHLVVSVDSAAAYQELAALSGEAAGEVLPDPAATPDQPLVLDMYLEDGELTAVEVDLTQFEDGDGEARVRVEFSDGEEVTAPDGAREVDLAPVLGLLMSSEATPAL